MELPHKWNFIAVAIPGIIGAIAIFFIQVKKKEAEPAAERKALNSVLTAD